MIFVVVYLHMLLFTFFENCGLALIVLCAGANAVCRCSAIDFMR